MRLRWLNDTASAGVAITPLLSLSLRDARHYHAVRCFRNCFDERATLAIFITRAIGGCCYERHGDYAMIHEMPTILRHEMLPAMIDERDVTRTLSAALLLCAILMLRR